jgi:hypothetical protein
MMGLAEVLVAHTAPGICKSRLIQSTKTWPGLPGEDAEHCAASML